MRARLPLLLILLLVLPGLVGCATTSGARRRAADDVQRVLDQALLLIGATKVKLNRKPYRSDCSGYVTAVFEGGVDLDLVDPRITTGSGSGTETIYRSLKGRGRIVSGKQAKPGDLAFFHNTWDRNGNKVRDDRFTHVALVERVQPDGTIHLLHYASGKVKRDFMNLKQPAVARDPETGHTVNSYLRRGGGKVLTGQLFFKFGRPLPR
jgi:peptidoglycan DL-endopeptidase CwlO